MNRKTGVGEAVGKVILMGEHSVVYGEPAISMPFFSARTRVVISECPGEVGIECDFYNGLLRDSEENLKGVKTIVERIVLDLDRELRGFKIEISTTIPIERGMGSSAAVAVAMTRALYDYFDENLDTDSLIYYTDVSEKIIHGNPSGLDGATIIGEQSLFYIKGEKFMPLDINIDGYLIVADSGEIGNTKKAVLSVRNLYDLDHDRTKSYIERLGDLARKSKAYLKNRKLEDLGRAMNEAQDILRNLNVSNNKLDSLVDRALKEGALGSKLTGGGLGGSMIALAADLESAKRIGKCLKEEGARDTWISYLGGSENGK